MYVPMAHVVPPDSLSVNTLTLDSTLSRVIVCRPSPRLSPPKERVEGRHSQPREGFPNVK